MICCGCVAPGNHASLHMVHRVCDVDHPVFLAKGWIKWNGHFALRRWNGNERHRMVKLQYHGTLRDGHSLASPGAKERRQHEACHDDLPQAGSAAHTSCPSGWICRRSLAMRNKKVHIDIVGCGQTRAVLVALLTCALNPT